MKLQRVAARLHFLLLLPLIHASQPSAKSPPATKLRPLLWGQLNFLHTTDTHGWHAGHLLEGSFSGDWGDYVAFGEHMQMIADAKGVDLLFVDTGDRIEGNGLSDASNPKGIFAREIFMQQHMDAVAIGNHELYHNDSSVNDLRTLVPRYGKHYLTSNVDIYDPETGKLLSPMGRRSLTFRTKNLNLKITAFGFLFDFIGNSANTIVRRVEDVIQDAWFRNAISEQVDIFLIIGHCPPESPEFSAVFGAIRAINPSVPIQFFGGHSHVRDFHVYDKASTAMQSGRYCETVGFVGIQGFATSDVRPMQPPHPGTFSFFRRYIDFNRFGFMQHTHTNESNFNTTQGSKITRRITEIRRSLDLDFTYGCAPQDYLLYTAHYPSPNSILSLLADEIIPKMVSKKGRENIPRLVFVNSGFVRFDIFKGPFTEDSSYIVAPFTSGFEYIRGVPYTLASRLLALFNADPKQWSVHPQQVLMVPQKDQYIHNGPSLVDGMRDQVSFMAEQSLTGLTPGYTTVDDFGQDGDDTPHAFVSYYNPPNAIQANASFPSGGNLPDNVDLVFFDFIRYYVLQGIAKLQEGQSESRNYTEGDIEAYLEEGETMNKLLKGFARQNWKC